MFERMHERGEVVWSKEYHRDGPVREHRVNIGKERLAAWYDDKGQLQGLQCSPAAKGVAPFHDLCGFRGKRTQPLRAGGQAVRRVYESGYLVEEEVTAGDGRPGRHTRYRQGKPHGEERLYAPSGRPERRLFWKDGRKDGLETAYHEDGERVVEEKEWKDGRAVVERTRWLNGRVKREVRYGPHDIAERTDFHDNGQKAEEGVLVGCRWGLCPDGKWTTWDERGRKVAEVTWRAGVRHGPAAEWLEDGRTATLEYQDGAVRHRVERNAQGEILLDERYAEDGSRL